VSSQGRAGARSESLAHGEEKPDAEKSLEEVAAEQDRAPEVRAETNIEAGTSSRRLPNRIVQFPKPDHPVSPDSGQKKTSRTTAIGIAPAPRWCHPGLMSSQSRRI
jgi:hypothetical protein